MLRYDNPELYRQLILGPRDEYKDYVSDVAKRMMDSYELATKNMTNPMRRAVAKEVAIAQAQEEIAAPELDCGELDEDEARDFLQDFYGGSGV